MCKRPIYLAAFVLLLDLGAAVEGAIITNVVRSDGASGNREPIGVYDGSTPPLPTQTGGWTDGNYCFSDRTFTWVNTPAEIDGAEYVRTFNSDKISSVTYTVTVSMGATVLLTCDDRFTTPQSYVDNIVRDFAAPGEFTDTGWDVFVGGDSDRRLSVYSAVKETGTYVFHDPASGVYDFYIIGVLPLPVKAFNPTPADAARVDADFVTLEWDPGLYAALHDVYISQDFDDVNTATTSSGGIYRGRQTELKYPPGEWDYMPVTPGSTYYWRIDEVGATDIWRGDIWSFSVVPNLNWNPTPADEARFVPVTTDLSWSNGALALVGHIIYLSTDFSGVNNAVPGTTSGPAYLGSTSLPTDTTIVIPGDLLYGTTYYWRADAVEKDAPLTVHKGEVWQFETIPDIPITDPTLIGWWTFDEGASEAVIDWSGHGNHGVIVGGAQRAPGEIEEAISLNGSSQYVEVLNSTSLNLTKNFTIAAWIHPDVVSGFRGIVTKCEGLTHKQYVFTISDGQIRLEYELSGNNYALSGGTVRAGEWQHAAVTIDSSLLVNLYVDGVSTASETAPGEVLAQSNPVVIGRWAGSYNSNYLGGLIDDVRVYNKTLSQSEIQRIMVDPIKASNPKPTNSETDVLLNSELSWTPGIDESTGNPYTKHNVYFGTIFSAVDSATTPIATLTDVNTYSPALQYDTDYYWRIDGVNSGGGAYKGHVWRFKTIYNPALAWNPAPAENTMIDADFVALAWSPGESAALHDVYFSENFDDVNTATTSSGGVYKGRQSELKYPPGPFDTIPVTWGKTYYWRIDEVNDTDPDSPWTGRLWRFTTIGLGDDCNGNGIPDEIDIATGNSRDYNENGVPDECDPDCNGNGVPDDLDIAYGNSLDCNGNGVPDECDPDCNGNGIPDECDIANGASTDENVDGIPDECQSEVRVVPVGVLIDPASTSEVRTTLPDSIEAVVRGSKYYLEIWASDTGATKTGLTGVYVDVSFCGQTSASAVEHGTVFTMFTDGDIQPGGVDELGGSTFSSGVGVEPNWVRIGWIEMSADIDAETCSISLLPSAGGVAAYGEGLVPWAFIGLGSFDLQILPPVRSYNLDGDSVIGVGDLSLFAPSWQQSVPPAQNAHDFDCDCFVGVGDLSWFATGWSKSPADPTILYPPCPGGGSCGKAASMHRMTPRGFTLTSLRPKATTTSGPVDVDVAFELVVLNAPSASGTTTILPASIGSIAQGQTYYVEVWVSDVGDISTGITSAYVDLHFPVAAASVTNVSHGNLFTLFPSGSVAAGVIDELGGSQLSPGVGVAPQWARVAVIRMRADAAPPSVTFSLSPSSTGVGSYGRGVIDWDDIYLGMASVPPKITGVVRTSRAAGLDGVLLFADNGGGSSLTDATGYYEVVVPQGWSGTVTPGSAEFSLSFDPDALSYSNVMNMFINQDYTAHNICDLDGDDDVTMTDFAYFADYWLQSGPELPANFDLQDIVSYPDLDIFIKNWLWTP